MRYAKTLAAALEVESRLMGIAVINYLTMFFCPDIFKGHEMEHQSGALFSLPLSHELMMT